MTKCTVIFDFCEGRLLCKVTQPPPVPGNQHAIFLLGLSSKSDHTLLVHLYLLNICTWAFVINYVLMEFRLKGFH